MRFIGIIEQNKAVVQSIVGFFLSKEDFSILFICQSLDEFKSLPIHSRRKASILFVEAGSSYFDHFRQVKYLKSINPQFQIFLLYPPILPRPGAVCLLDKLQLESALEWNFSQTIAVQLSQEDERKNGSVHEPEPVQSPETLLTIRETEIAELVMTGLTSKAIAEMLCVSTHTVNAHLRRIFSKLSIKTRTELAFKMINP